MIYSNNEGTCIVKLNDINKICFCQVVLQVIVKKIFANSKRKRWMVNRLAGCLPGSLYLLYTQFICALLFLFNHLIGCESRNLTKKVNNFLLLLQGKTG